MMTQKFWLFPFRFRATLYPCRDTAAERQEMAIGVTTRIEDLQTVSNIYWSTNQGTIY